METRPDLDIRRAGQPDASALAQLRLEFRTGRAPMIETEEQFVARCLAWMDARLDTTSPWRVWVARSNNRPVGNVWLQVVEKLPNPAAEAEMHAYVSNFFVQPDHRNSGVGTRLLKAVLDECARLEVDSVFLWPTARSRPLYERFGFKSDNGMLALER